MYPPDRQVPLPSPKPETKYPDGSSRPASHKIVLDIVKYHDDPRRARIRQVPLSPTSTTYRRKNETVQTRTDKYPNVMCITTVDRGFIKFLSETNLYHYYLYERGETVYFRYELDPFRKVSPRRYNPETTPVNE